MSQRGVLTPRPPPGLPPVRVPPLGRGLVHALPERRPRSKVGTVQNSEEVSHGALHEGWRTIGIGWALSLDDEFAGRVTARDQRSCSGAARVRRGLTPAHT